MGVSSAEMFGQPSGAGPVAATEGSYGRPPAEYRLPNATRLGGVELRVSDLARSLAYYQQVLGFGVLRSESGSADLGIVETGDTIVRLCHEPGTVPLQPGARLGLYHFAILLPDRAALGRFITHLASIGARARSSDHLVSEALYMQDPDGLGIEVYVDRPRNAWLRVGRELMMATDPLDIADLVQSAQGEPWTGMPAGTVIGHVHLHVGDVAAADEFYAEGIGFDRTVWRYRGALFLGAGGYHHHLGTNTWARGATAPRANDAKLRRWTILLPSEEDVAQLKAHAAARGLSFVDEDAGVLLTDPWGTSVLVASSAA